MRSARVVALSLTHDLDDGRLRQELIRVHQGIGDGAEILLGGRSASTFADLTRLPRVHLVRDMAQLQCRLVTLHAAPDPGAGYGWRENGRQE